MLAALVAAAVLAPGTWVVVPSGSTLRYLVVHKLHPVGGVSTDVEGKVLVRPDGTVLAEVRVPVASFKSGDGNRDEHMMEALEAGTWPFVVFKGIAQRQTDQQMDGEIDLHGVKKRYRVAVQVSPQPDRTVRVRGQFDVRLEAHRIERPSLFFIKIDDACRIELDLLLREEK